MDEVGWIVYCLDDVVTDAQFYGFGDIREMTGPDALRIVYRLPDYFDYVPDSGHAKSSVVKFFKRMQQEQDENTVLELDELNDEDAEVVEV